MERKATEEFDETIGEMWASLTSWGMAEPEDKHLYRSRLDQLFGTNPPDSKFYKSTRTKQLKNSEVALVPAAGYDYQPNFVPDLSSANPPAASLLIYPGLLPGCTAVTVRDRLPEECETTEAVAVRLGWPAQDDPRWCQVFQGVRAQYGNPSQRLAYSANNTDEVHATYRALAIEFGISETLPELVAYAEAWVAELLDPEPERAGMDPAPGNAEEDAAGLGPAASGGANPSRVDLNDDTSLDDQGHVVDPMTLPPVDID